MLVIVWYWTEPRRDCGRNFGFEHGRKSRQHKLRKLNCRLHSLRSPSTCTGNAVNNEVTLIEERVPVID